MKFGNGVPESLNFVGNYNFGTFYKTLTNNFGLFEKYRSNFKYLSLIYREINVKIIRCYTVRYIQ